MQALFEYILPVFVIIGFGYAATWKGIFSESAIDGLVKFTQNFAIPCLIFRAISEMDIGAFSAPLVFSYYIAAFACFALGYLGARRVFGRRPEDAVAIGFCCLYSNAILLGLPITERAYGPEALESNFAIIAFHAPLCYMLGVTAMELVRSGSLAGNEKAARVARSMFRNPLVIGIALGLIANVTALPLPRPLIAGVDLLSEAALPAALFSLGGVLVQYRPEGDSKTILMICAVSLGLQPLLVIGLASLLALDQAALRSAVLTAAMAPGVNAYVFAHMYGAAQRVAAASVLIGTAASIFSVWLWLLVLN